jgi:urease accessory protein
LNGCLVLRAGVRDGRTVLLGVEGRYPLQVMRPQTSGADGRLSLVVLLLSGGLLDGDEVSIDVTLEPGARLALRTQAATQVHSGVSYQRMRVSVDEGAWFSYVPQALVPHACADFRSCTEIVMARGARVLVAETLAPGRMQFGSGELFAYARVRLELDAWCEGSLVARERAVVQPDVGLRLAQFGPSFTHTSAVYALGPGQAPSVVSSGALIECSSLARGAGWYMRALGRRAVDVEGLLGGVEASWWAHRLNT